VRRHREVPNVFGNSTFWWWYRLFI